jgi:hypothetical protein
MRAHPQDRHRLIPWPSGRPAAHGGAPASLAAALQSLRPRWTVLTEARVADGADRFVIPYVLVHAACGVALLEPGRTARATRTNTQSAIRFRNFLDAGEFASFYPGYLPVVSLPIEQITSADPATVLVEAFANLPLLTIKDPGWADALVTVLKSGTSLDDPPRREPIADKRSASIAPITLAPEPASSPTAPSTMPQEGARPQENHRAAIADGAGSSTQPIHLRVDPALRREPGRQTRNVPLTIAGVLFMMVLAVAAMIVPWRARPTGNDVATIAPSAAPAEQPQTLPPAAATLPPEPSPPVSPPQHQSSPPPPLRPAHEPVAPQDTAAAHRTPPPTATKPVGQATHAPTDITARARAAAPPPRRAVVAEGDHLTNPSHAAPVHPAWSYAETASPKAVAQDRCEDCPPVDVTDLPPLAPSPETNGN